MGREAVKVLVAKMKGETVPLFIDTGAAVITKENLDAPEIQALLACFFPVFSHVATLHQSRSARPRLGRASGVAVGP
jgi:hypothetical protein